MPQSLQASAMSIPSPPYISMMFPPPGAMMTELPLAAPSRGRNTVRNGASSGPVPAARGTCPASHSGILRYVGGGAFGSAPETADHARTSATDRRARDRAFMLEPSSQIPPGSTRESSPRPAGRCARVCRAGSVGAGSARRDGVRERTRAFDQVEQALDLERGLAELARPLRGAWQRATDDEDIGWVANQLRGLLDDAVASARDRRRQRRQGRRRSGVAREQATQALGATLDVVIGTPVCREAVEAQRPAARPRCDRHAGG